MPFAGLCQPYPLPQLVPVTPGRGRRCPTWWWWHCGRPLLERRPLSPRPQARGRWAAGDAPTLGLSPPLLFLMPLFYIHTEKSPFACCKSLSRCQRCAGPCPPSPPPSRGPAQTSPRHGQDLSPLDHPEHYRGLKVASARRARPPPSRPPAAGGRRWVAGSPLPGRGGVGRGCPQPATSLSPHGPPADPRAPGGWRGRGSARCGIPGPRLPKPGPGARGCQFPGGPKREQPFK